MNVGEVDKSVKLKWMKNSPALKKNSRYVINSLKSHVSNIIWPDQIYKPLCKNIHERVDYYSLFTFNLFLLRQDNVIVVDFDLECYVNSKGK